MNDMKLVKKVILKGKINTPQGVRYYRDLPDKPQINGITLLGNKSLDELGIQSKESYASTQETGVIKVGDNLRIDDEGFLSVDTTNETEQDNTKPITSAGVYRTVGNINALLEKI